MEALLKKSVRGKRKNSSIRFVSSFPLPWEENALHHIEVLHQDISLWLGAQVADCVPDAQLDGPLQGGGSGLVERKEHCVSAQCDTPCTTAWPSKSDQLLSQESSAVPLLTPGPDFSAHYQRAPQIQTFL